MSNIHAAAQLVRKLVIFIQRLNGYLNHFPKSEKYALANRIRNTAYEVFDLVVEGEKRYTKKTTLSSLDIAHERLRMQLFLAFELGYFRYRDGRKDEHPEKLEQKRYTHIGDLCDELGRMIGGWIVKMKEMHRW
jgi:four helix bundle protein